MDILQAWVFFAVVAVVCKSGYYLLQKKYLDNDISPYTTAYISAFYGSIITFPLALWDIINNGIEITVSLIGLLILFGIAESVYLLIYLFALNNLNLSIASPFKKSKPAFLAFVEPFILSAVLSPILVISSITAALGGVLTVVGSADSLDTYKNDITKIGLFFALLTLIASTGISLISRFGTSEISPFVFGFGVSVTMLVVTRLLLFQSDVSEKALKIQSREGLYLGTIGGLRSVFVWMAYSLATATAVSTVTQSTLILDVLLANYYLDENVTRLQTVGIVIIFSATLIAIIIGG